MRHKLCMAHVYDIGNIKLVIRKLNIAKEIANFNHFSHKKSINVVIKASRNYAKLVENNEH